MKRRNLYVLILALVLLSLLAGCGAQSGNSYAGDSMIVTEAVVSGAEGIYGSVGSQAAAVTDRKLIRTIELDAETEDLDALVTTLQSKVTELGGYIESREVYSGSAYASYTPSRSAQLTIRIPAEGLDAFVSHVEDEGNVISSSESSEDVTLSYVATESRMKALQKEEERLLALIDQAADLSELLQLESRLTEVRTELESVTSQLRLYDNLVDYGTVHLSIREVQKLTPVEEPGFWQRIGTGFSESMANLGNFLKELVIWLVVMLPYLIPFAVIGVAVLLIVKLTLRRKRKSRKPPFSEDPKE